jgi:hypothetical protein
MSGGSLSGTGTTTARRRSGRAWGSAWAALGLLAAGACTPSVPHDPTPASMEFDPQAIPPRVPQPTGLVIDPHSGHINFGLAGPPVSADCSMPAPLSQAECEFDTYLQTLDGFPTVTPATAPVSAALDLTTATLGTNVVAVAVAPPPLGTAVSGLHTAFDGVTSQLTIAPAQHWNIGETYWIGVRGYANGVRAADGSEVVGSPVMALLKQETPLTCGAATAASIDPNCPAFALLSQPAKGAPPPDPAATFASLQTLESIRLAYIAGGAWNLMAAHGLPKSEIAVLWGFPIHSASVAELDPTADLVPKPTSATQIQVAVQGTVDPATVSAFSIGGPTGTSVMVLDLDELQAGNLAAGFLNVTASYADGQIVVDASAPFTDGHQIGIFMRNKLHDAGGLPLVPSPVSVLLTLQGALVDAHGKSTISTVGDDNANLLEAGRQQLGMLLDNGMLGLLTGNWLQRSELVYCYAFAFKAPPP